MLSLWLPEYIPKLYETLYCWLRYHVTINKREETSIYILSNLNPYYCMANHNKNQNKNVVMHDLNEKEP